MSESDSAAQTWTLSQIDYLTDTLLFALQTDEPQLEESKDPGVGPPSGEPAEGQGEGIKEGDVAPEKGGEQDTCDGDTDKPPDEHDEVEASAAIDIEDTEVSSQQKDVEGEKEDHKSEEAKNGANGSGGEALKEKRDEEEEKSKIESRAKEEKKEVSEKTASVKKQVKEVNVEVKDRVKTTEDEKPGKAKRKGGPPASSLSRPRPSARSIRAAAKNDIIAKFQKGASE